MVDYRHNYEAFDRLVLCAPWMVDHMFERAQKIKLRAEATAPFDPSDPDGTHYRDSFQASSGIRETPSRRAYGRVENTDMPTAIFVEFGAWNVPRYRTLGNALDGAAGTVHLGSLRSIFKGTQFEPPAPKPRKPKGSTNG